MSPSIFSKVGIWLKENGKPSEGGWSGEGRALWPRHYPKEYVYRMRISFRHTVNPLVQ